MNGIISQKAAVGRVNPKILAEVTRQEVPKISSENLRLLVDKFSPVGSNPRNNSSSYTSAKIHGKASCNNENTSASQIFISLPKVSQNYTSKATMASSVFFDSLNSKKQNPSTNIRISQPSSNLSTFLKIASSKSSNLGSAESQVVKNLNDGPLEGVDFKAKENPSSRSATPRKNVRRNLRSCSKLISNEEKDIIKPPKPRESTSQKQLRRNLKLSKFKDDIDTRSKAILESRELRSEEKLNHLLDSYREDFETIVESLNMEEDEPFFILNKIWVEMSEFTKNLLIKINKENMAEVEKVKLEMENMRIRFISEQKYSDTRAITENENLRRHIKLLEQELRSTYDSLIQSQREKKAINIVLPDRRKKRRKSLFRCKSGGSGEDSDSMNITQNDVSVASFDERPQPKLFCEIGVSTLDHLCRENKQVYTCYSDFQKEVQTQTDLFDLIESIEPLSLTPVRSPRANHSPFHLRMAQIAYDEDVFQVEDQNEIQERLESLKNKSGNPFYFRQLGLNSKEWEFLSTQMNDVRAGDALKKYQSEMDKYYKDVESVIQTVKNGEINLEVLLAMEERTVLTKKFMKDVIEFVTKSEEELFLKFLNKNIEVAESKLESAAQIRVAENWQKRLNRIFQKHQRTQEILFHEGGSSKQRLEELDTTFYKKLTVETRPRGASNTPAGNGFTPYYRKTTKKLASNNALNNSTEQYKLRKSQTINLESSPSEKSVDLSLIKRKKYSGINKQMSYPKRKVHKNVVSLNTKNASKFLRKLKQLPMIPKEEVKVDAVCKLISALFTEILKQGTRGKERMNPLFFYLYDYLMNRFGGINKTAEEKIIIIVRSSLIHKDNYPKIKLFLKLLGIIEDEPYEYDGTDLAYYMYSLIELEEENLSHPGLSLSMSSKERTHIPLKRAIGFITSEFQKNESISRVVNLDSVLVNMKKEKINDPLIAGRQLIDADYVIELMNGAKQDFIILTYKQIFDSISINNDKVIDLEQFQLIWRTIERRKYSFDKAMEVFEQEYDMIDDESNQKFISFRQFANIAQKLQLFRPGVIETFNETTWDDVKTLDQLDKTWGTKKIYIKLKLIKMRMYTEIYRALIKSLDEYFEKGLSAADQKASILWMRYRILDEEATQGYLEIEAEKIINIFDSKLLDISFAYNKILVSNI